MGLHQHSWYAIYAKSPDEAGRLARPLVACWCAVLQPLARFIFYPQQLTGREYNAAATLAATMASLVCSGDARLCTFSSPGNYYVASYHGGATIISPMCLVLVVVLWTAAWTGAWRRIRSDSIVRGAASFFNSLVGALLPRPATQLSWPGPRLSVRSADLHSGLSPRSGPLLISA